MTDEEKAEEYSDNLDLVKERNPELKTNDDFIKQAYLDGLAEGRKELEQWKQEWQDAQIKANEEGFARTTLQIKYLELEKENEQLKCDLYNTEANLRGMTINCEKLENKNTELKEQIEKMKCCGNCKHLTRKLLNCENIQICKVNPNNIYGVCDIWELLE